MIALRLMSADDAERIRAWRMDPEVARWMYTQPVITPDQQRQWVEAALADSSRCYWIITLDDEPVGLANLVDIDRGHGRCAWAFYLADARTRGRGVGGAVEYAVLTFVFETLGLRKLCCEVLSANEAVLGLHKSFGFVEEGRRRRHVVIGGEIMDVVEFGILAEEWAAIREQKAARLKEKGVNLPVAPICAAIGAPHEG